MAMDVMTRRSVSGSPRKMIPPMAAITGTDNWTLAADVFLRAGKTVYQMAYQTPEARAPDATA